MSDDDELGEGEVGQGSGGGAEGLGGVEVEVLLGTDGWGFFCVCGGGLLCGSQRPSTVENATHRRKTRARPRASLLLRHGFSQNKHTETGADGDPGTCGVDYQDD